MFAMHGLPETIVSDNELKVLSLKNFYPVMASNTSYQHHTTQRQTV
jgi:hypothetical protein